MKKIFKDFKKKLQNQRIKFGKWILDKPKNPNNFPNRNVLNIQNQDIQKILFLRQDGKIGDYIVSSFVFREIKRLNPNIQIGVVCTDKNQDLFLDNQNIDKIHLVKDKSMLSYYQVGNEISKLKYDVVIDPTVFLRNRDLVLIRNIQAKYNIGYLKNHYNLFNLNINEPLHFSEIYHRALELCGFQDIELKYDIPEKINFNQEIQQFLNENKIELNEYIVVNFFGASRSRQFNFENMYKLIEIIEKKLPNKKIVLLTYPQVTPTLKQLQIHIRQTLNKNIYFFEKSQSIYSSIALIKWADYVISPDTAIIHIAKGFDKKIIAFYSQDKQNYTNWHPNSDKCQTIFYPNNVNELDFAELSNALIKANE